MVFQEVVITLHVMVFQEVVITLGAMVFKVVPFRVVNQKPSLTSRIATVCHQIAKVCHSEVPRPSALTTRVPVPSHRERVAWEG